MFINVSENLISGTPENQIVVSEFARNSLTRMSLIFEGFGFPGRIKNLQHVSILVRFKYKLHLLLLMKYLIFESSSRILEFIGVTSTTATTA